MSDIPALTESDAVSAPRYREIHDALRAKIVSGAWPPGFKLPSEPELARSFDCARMTVGKALTALADKGFITRRRRAGTRVNSPRPQESVLEIHDIEAEVRTAGHDYRYRCLTRECRPATASDASALNVPIGTPVLEITGLHCADGRPHALEERLINLQAVPDARRERFSKVSPGGWLLSRIPWTEAEHQISALNANSPMAQRLQITRHKACLCIERRTWHQGQRITYVRLIYPCDHHRLVARFQHGSP
ncbi:MAG TPA: histidine utilization repressor [Steroidobacteraceae bacterium]|nr:histidine utilization repressor [Steroidobacteraceae bacterium]